MSKLADEVLDNLVGLSYQYTLHIESLDDPDGPTGMGWQVYVTEGADEIDYDYEADGMAVYLNNALSEAVSRIASKIGADLQIGVKGDE